MAEHPMFPFWTDAYFGDTVHLTTFEHGAYILMLLTAWRTGQASLPNDHEFIRKTLKMRRDEWAKHSATLLSFWAVEGDRLVQSRLRDEWAYTVRRSQHQAEKGRRRWALKRLNSGEATAQPQHSNGSATAEPPLPTTLPKEIKNKEKGPNTPDWRERVQNFKARRHWSSNWGPVPGKPYCDAPSAILKEFGFGA
jgi:uncharacterized protein YdaU (DUF1376 family)